MRIQKGFFVLALLGLSGCGRVIDWGKDLVSQGTDFKENLAQARDYVRSITAYDQLSTAATFDALWLSDEVRSGYVRLFVDRRGKGEEQYATIVRRQLEENNFVIAFYILCPFEITLGDAEADWMVFLRVNNAQYTPTEVKIVDLAPEYRAIFDKKVTRFKQAYSVKFDARDANDVALIGASTKTLSLVFRSMKKDLTLNWQVPKSVVKPVIPNEIAPKIVPDLKPAQVSSAAVPALVQTPTAVAPQKTVKDQTPAQAQPASAVVSQKNVPAPALAVKG
jgi:hypothetical protein